MNTTHLALPLLAVLSLAAVPAWAAPVLGSSLSNFAVLGAAAVTNAGVANTGSSTLVGDLGVSNNASISGITGFYGTLANDGPGAVTGAVIQGGAIAQTADNQLSAAMVSLGLLGPGTTLGSNLTGLTLAPGIYTVAAGTTNLTGVLTLNGGGNANAVWVFQMPSTLITSAGSDINVINTGAGAGVYWNVGSSATLDAGTQFVGNILASASITLDSGVALSCGRALAHTGAVTLIDDTINAGNCSGIAAGSHGLSGGLAVAELGGMPTVLPYSAITAVPEPGSMALFACGFAALLLATRQRYGRWLADGCGLKTV